MRENEPCQKVKSDDEECGFCNDANTISNGDDDVKNTTEILMTMIKGWMRAHMGYRGGGWWSR